MRPLLTSIVSLFCFFDLSGQAFVTRLLTNGSRTLKMDTLLSGNIVAAQSFQSGASLFDNNGALLNTSCHLIGVTSGMARLQSINKVNDTIFVFSSSIFNDSFAPLEYCFNPVYGTMDTTGTIISSFYYVLDDSECSYHTADDLMRCNNGDHILWGYESPMFLLRCTLDGAVVWAKNFDHDGGIAFVRELPNSDLLIGHNVQPLHGVVTRMTAAGEVLWSKSYDTEQGMVADAVIHSDDSFTIVGYTDSSTVSFQPRPTDYQPELFLLRLSGSGEVQWARAYNTAPYFWYTQIIPRVAPMPDGNMVILATIGPSSNYIREHRPYLMKVDLNGDTLWTRSYGESGQIFRTASLQPCADGSVLYSMVDEYLSYLVRTEPNGRLPCNNEHYGLTVSELFLSDTNVVLTATEGAQVYPAQVTPIPCEDMMLEQPCVANPLAAPEWWQPARPRIRPNPTPGAITVELPSPLRRDTFYSVIDATGRLLYERPLPPGATTVDIDLSRFGKGTYILRITDPHGQRNERVVVE